MGFWGITMRASDYGLDLLGTIVDRQTIRAILCPVGAGNKDLTVDSAAFGVLIPEYLCFQRPIQRQDSKTEMCAADRERDCLRTDTGVAIVQDKAVAARVQFNYPCFLPAFTAYLQPRLLSCAIIEIGNYISQSLGGFQYAYFEEGLLICET